MYLLEKKTNFCKTELNKIESEYTTFKNNFPNKVLATVYIVISNGTIHSYHNNNLLLAGTHLTYQIKPGLAIMQ